MVGFDWMMVGCRDGGGETSGMTAGERRDQQRQEEALHASSLRVPRRYGDL